MTPPPRLAGIELGGTKSIAVLAEGHEIVAEASIATRDPHSTLAELNGQLLAWDRAEPLAGLGIASFGPLQLDCSTPGFGSILATPKPGWSGARVAEALTLGLAIPWRIDTDVNGAALAEYMWGAGQGCDSVCYLTIGTGVGGGLVIGGACVHGAMHPEIGHLRLRRAPGDSFAGACPFHGDCIEGLVSGPALAARFAQSPSAIPDDDPRWAYVASDIAELFGALLLAASPQRILLGGSVALARQGVIDRARGLVVERYGAYLPYLTLRNAGQLIGIASLGARAGPLGAIALASLSTRRPSVLSV
ncbi:MAG: fructokinase [Sphingomonadales bacterium 32-68-7]|nr:MAG: fructokinase [Sphingomonadales bacterium 12-68-11]OYX08713.1 MAG: fructokinase [Sphingomonadales bacterium 32-68-7]